MGQIILSDEKCVGHAVVIFRDLKRLGYQDLLEVELRTFESSGLAEGLADKAVWQFCQENGYLLLTGNRTTKDGHRSLEFVIRHLVKPTSLPVLTIGNLERTLTDPDYCERCAERLAVIVADLHDYLGITRLYLT